MSVKRAAIGLFATVAGLLMLAAACQPEPTPTPIPTLAPPAATPAVASPTTAPATPTPVSPGPTTAAATPTVAPTPAPAVKTGTLELRVTDAPPEGVTKVVVTAGKIEAQRSGSEGETGWVTIVESPPTFDLVSVEGFEEVLGSNPLPEGSYGQVRLSINKVVVTVKGEDKEAEVPSDKLRVIGTIQVAANKTTAVTLDFDADQSVVLAGPRVQFKPVVKLLVEAPADKPSPLKRPKAGATLTVPLRQVGGSGQSGTATLTEYGRKTEVVIDVKAGPTGVRQPSHIHDTDCTLPPRVIYPLSNVVDGKATTLVNASLATLQSKKFAICVHKSPQEVTIYVSEGEIPQTASLAVQATITDYLFPSLTVSVGTTVTWTNQHVTHTFTAGQNGQWDGKGWNSPEVAPGKSFGFTFATKGTFSYTCRIHPSLNATVTVTESGTAPAMSEPTPTPSSGGGSSY
ncbi:MAG: DUF4382 domain-containing protein [Chloroflexi bacterium]|nr:DUF4382 domain-containing protein [Chloroflexota bacterium]